MVLISGVGWAIPAQIQHPEGGGGGGLADCTGLSAYQQPLDAGNYFTARNSDQEAALLTVEDLVDGAGVITPFTGSVAAARWWGVSRNALGTGCSDDDSGATPFDLTFYADAAGSPGAVVATVAGVVPTIVDTGLPFASTTIREFSVDVAPVDVVGAAWVSVQRQVGVSGCFWFWVDESLVGTYDDRAFQAGTVTSDQTICLAAAPPNPVEIPTLAPAGGAALALLVASAGLLAVWARRRAAGPIRPG